MRRLPFGGSAWRFYHGAFRLFLAPNASTNTRDVLMPPQSILVGGLLVFAGFNVCLPSSLRFGLSHSQTLASKVASFFVGLSIVSVFALLLR